MANLRVAVDAGHGYNTAGKRSAPFLRAVVHTYDNEQIIVKKGEQFREHVANAGVAYYLALELMRYGIDVFLSGFKSFDGSLDKTDLSINQRQKAIRLAQCDYSLSCHFNAYGNANAFNSGQGIETLYHSVASKVGDGKNLAAAIQNRIQSVYNQKNRGIVGGSDWGMCNSTGMGVKAAVIMEYAFMTNQHEAELYFCNPESWHQYAVATAQGFIDYVTGGVPTNIIDKNSDGKTVMWLQMMLNRVIDAKLTIDGKLGAMTAAAIKEYWKLKGWNMPKATGYYIGMGTIKCLAREGMC